MSSDDKIQTWYHIEVVTDGEGCYWYPREDNPDPSERKFSGYVASNYRQTDTQNFRRLYDQLRDAGHDVKEPGYG